MQITFDPFNKRESEFVRQVLGVAQITHTFIKDVEPVNTAPDKSPVADHAPDLPATIAQADQPDVGMTIEEFLEPIRRAQQSAAPLEQPAPLPAAADLFGTAPVAPSDGEASAPIVPPPPVPSAPPAAASSANALPVIPAGDVDKHGLPWDDRIHSGTRVKNADGSWRQRRGVDAHLVKTVENELRALMALPTRPGITLGSADFLAEPQQIPAPPAPVTPIAATPAVPDGNGATTEGNVPPPPVPAPPTSAPATAPIPSPPVPPAPIAAEPAAPLTFATMLRKVTDALAQNKIKETDVHAALEKIGLLPTQIGLLSARADLLPAFHMHIAAAIGAGHA